MPPPVFTFTPNYPVSHRLKRQFIENDYGDGYNQIMSSEVAFTRAGGVGDIASYRGVNTFTIKFDKALTGSGNLANNLWLFMRDRLDNLNEAFYFYNPSERNIPDPTGAATVGRYLVRLANPNEIASREFFMYCLYSYGLEFIEERP